MGRGKPYFPLSLNHKLQGQSSILLLPQLWSSAAGERAVDHWRSHVLRGGKILSVRPRQETNGLTQRTEVSEVNIDI